MRTLLRELVADSKELLLRKKALHFAPSGFELEKVSLPPPPVEKPKPKFETTVEPPPVKKKPPKPIQTPQPAPKKAPPPPNMAIKSMRTCIATFLPEVLEIEPAPPGLILAMPGEQEFLERVALAMSQRLAPTSVKLSVNSSLLKKFIASPTLKLLLATPLAMQTACIHPLKPHQKGASLGSVPLFPLAPISDYLHNPALKKELWEELQLLYASCH